jgi:alpha-tubulin suppressor-like RCC1 family protein
MRGVHGTSRPGGSHRRLGRSQVFRGTGHGTLTSLVTFAAAVVVAAVLPLTAATTASATGSTIAWAHISAGGEQTCGVSTGRALFCWGGNSSGELGIGSTTNADLPQPVTTPAVTGWATVSAGGEHTCAIRTNRTLWCWGGNAFGQLGIGNTTNADLPQQVAKPSAGGWATISTGLSQTCATRTDGTLWCWGENDSGQLGIGNTTPSEDLPQQVTTPSATGWATVAAGGFHTCATRTDTTLWCWGNNFAGQLGIGSTTNADLPQQVTMPAATGWATVTGGGDHVCATRADTSLWCWGSNFAGQLGIGSTAASENLPQQVTTPSATGWAAVTGGTDDVGTPPDDHTCATRGDGTLWCWGANYIGQLGIGSSGSKHLPQQVAKSATTPWATVSGGADHTCATRTNRTLWCWGDNVSGELGLGNTTNQTRPKQVTA